MTDVGYSLLYYALPILGLIITGVAQISIKANYGKYKKIDAASHKSGREVARQILDKHNLKNIEVVEVSGDLTDHYDPTKKVIRLSSDIYSGKSIASVSVAAHECGHAIQDKEAYGPMRVRSKLVPIVNFSTKIGYLVIAIGLAAGLLKVAAIGLILLMSMLLFQLVTLPVEFDASRRGKEELQKLGLITDNDKKGTKKVLNAAAFTYVAGFLASALQIVRLVLISRRRN